jgi:hypothetical protein
MAPGMLNDLPEADPGMMHEDRVDEYAGFLSQMMDETDKQIADAQIALNVGEMERELAIAQRTLFDKDPDRFIKNSFFYDTKREADEDITRRRRESEEAVLRSRSALKKLKSGQITGEQYQQLITDFESRDKAIMGRKPHRAQFLGLEDMHRSIQQGVLNRKEEQALELQKKAEKHLQETMKNTGKLVDLLQNPKGATFN